MPKSWFRGGVHPVYHKDLSATHAIEIVPLPQQIEIPISQHIGVPASPVVAKGDEVLPGQLLAKAPSLISANVHSPVAGKVRNLIRKPMPGGSTSECLQIQVDADATAEHS